VDNPIELVLPDGVGSLADMAAVFAARLAPGDEIVVEVPLPSVGSSNSYLDLVADFADASLICERLGLCANGRSIQWGKSGHKHVIHLALRGYIAELMALELAWMTILLDWPNSEIESLRDHYYEARDACVGHEENIHQASLLFPEIADHYLGNLVMGAYYEWEDTELLAAELRLHPERRYGFFISRSMNSDSLPVLSSDGQLIVPSEVPLEKVLESLGYDGEQLLPATMVLTERNANFAGSHTVVGVRAEDVLNAIACGDDFVRRARIEPDALELLAFQGRPGASVDEPIARVGELSGCAALTCSGFTVLFLDAQPISGDQRAAEADRLRTLEVSMRDGGSPSPRVDLAWEALDDELFEQLCYDYLYVQPLFDRSRFEKIGKSRSRDGGRDIVAWTTVATPMFRLPTKYIFQCKHIAADASLTPKHFQSVSDVIEQYGAGGYGVMCSGYIDATLHDRIDAIAAKRSLDVRKVDRLLLERFLFSRPHLIERYFRNRSKAQC
jgi:hypothetical protein